LPRAPQDSDSIVHGRIDGSTNQLHSLADTPGFPKCHVDDFVHRCSVDPEFTDVAGHQPELEDQDARQVRRSLLTSLLAPEAQQSFLVFAHDDPGVGAADEVASRRTSHNPFHNNRQNV
jgi:hypothetical protein